MLRLVADSPVRIARILNHTVSWLNIGGVPVEKNLYIVGYIPYLSGAKLVHLPKFREYANQKYSDELDEDLIHD